jgi:hypothetical protein
MFHPEIFLASFLLYCVWFGEDHYAAVESHRVAHRHCFPSSFILYRNPMVFSCFARVLRPPMNTFLSCNSTALEPFY